MPLGLVVAAVAGWLLIPGRFARGIIVGISATLALLVGGMALFVRRMRKRMESALSPPPLPTGAWDYRMDVEDLSGDPVDVEQFRGSVLVLNFWATWCAPCVAEMPSLERLRQATSDLGVAFACVTPEEPAVVRKFIADREIDLPVYIQRGDTPEHFETRSIPATFVIDPSGLVAMRHFGAAAWDDDSVVAYVGGLAAAPD